MQVNMVHISVSLLDHKRIHLHGAAKTILKL